MCPLRLTHSRLASQSWIIQGDPFAERFDYNDPDEANPSAPQDGSLKRMTTAAGATIDFAYDALKRLSGTTVKNSGGTTVLTHAYAYKNLGTTNGITQTTTQVEYHNVRNAMGVVISGAKYTYDALGNITEISKSEGSYYPLVKYEYDSQNQLTKETFYDGSGSADSNITATYEYTYDTAGNIHTVSKDGTVTQSYSYSTGDWKDLLVSVNGTSLTYDGAGNPTSYPRLRDQGSYYMQWDNGRQLTYLDYASSASSETQIRFAYDADGIRTSKTITKGTTETVHNYVTQNGKVVRETIGTGSTAKVLDFIYDESGKPFALKYSANGGSSFTTYYYVLNLQGDVVAIMNTNQSIAAKYSYTAWGDVLAVTYNNGSAITGKTHIGNLNPIRYRGYYYDTETGFYYLQSRYYDPMMRRFINADSLVSTGQGVIGTNSYVYCLNNSVSYADATGNVATICLGLDLPPGAGIPVVIDGQTYYYHFKLTSHGELYEYWYNLDGDLEWVRHHSDHGGSKHHGNPHDHKGTKDKNGENTEEKTPRPVNPRFCSPKDARNNSYKKIDVRRVAETAVVVFVIYEVVKWSLALIFAAPSGGGSLAGAAALP